MPVDPIMGEEIKKGTCVDTEVSDKYVLEAIKECNTHQWKIKRMHLLQQSMEVIIL